jgi:hypothetical protein
MLKKYLFIVPILFLAMQFAAAQQPFAPVGTKWYYSEVGPWDIYGGYYEDYILIESTGVAIIDGKPCSILSDVKETMFCYRHSDPTYAYQSNDTVFFYDGEDFFPMYIWNAQAGDSWQTLYEVSVTVDSVKTETIFGQQATKQYVTYSYPNPYYAPTGGIEEYFGTYTGEVIENIGDLSYLYGGFDVDRLGISLCCQSVNYQGIRCYMHPDLGTHSFKDIDCDYYHITSAITELELEHLIVTPEFVQLPDISAKEVIIYNANGQCILNANLNSDRKIMINNLNSGVYLIRAILKNNNIKTFKFVKS